MQHTPYIRLWVDVLIEHFVLFCLVLLGWFGLYVQVWETWGATEWSNRAAPEWDDQPQTGTRQHGGKGRLPVLWESQRHSGKHWPKYWRFIYTLTLLVTYQLDYWLSNLLIYLFTFLLFTFSTCIVNYLLTCVQNYWCTDWLQHWLTTRSIFYS